MPLNFRNFRSRAHEIAGAFVPIVPIVTALRLALLSLGCI